MFDELLEARLIEWQAGVRIGDHQDGMAFAEAVIAAQGEDLVAIGWSAKDVYELRDGRARVAWGWMGKCRG